MAPPEISVGMAGPIFGLIPPYKPNDVISYNCASGYIIRGTRFSTCVGGPNFEWTLMGGNVPICIKSKLLKNRNLVETMVHLRPLYLKQD